MAQIEVETHIAAPQAFCFDLARDISVHVATTGTTGERVVELTRNGVSVDPATHNLLEDSDIVTFEARHFGIRQRLTSKIVAFDRPHEFTDEMQRGAFRRLRHVHRFEREGDGTIMIDLLDFEAPFPGLGRIAEALFLERYMKRFLADRGAALKAIAETRSAEP